MVDLYQFYAFLKHFVGTKKVLGEVDNEILSSLNSNTCFYCFEEIEGYRRNLLKNDKEINVNDLGAGSKFFKNSKRKVKDIAKYSLKSSYYAQLLFRISNYLRAQTIVELGTSLGLTTSYLAKASSKGIVYSIEGCENTAKIAINTFQNLKVGNVELRIGDIKDKLPELIGEIGSIDLALVDGNHCGEATLRYFELLLKRS